MTRKKVDIAVVLPCYNEELTIGKVIKDFGLALPNASIYVCDNRSSDNTAKVAREAGAYVLVEPLSGKANAVRRLFQTIDSDIYILSDGDFTYDAKAAPELVDLLKTEKLDMVVGARNPIKGQKVYRPGHSFGNLLFTLMIKLFFGGNLNDVLSGYRILSRDFVKSFPILSSGFDIEMEMTVHALALGLPVSEKKINYAERPEGSHSKLKTISDGFLIIRTLLKLFIDFRPLNVFLPASFIQILLAVWLFQPVMAAYLDTGLVERLPSAILSLGLVITGLFTAFSGIILNSISRHRIESKRLSYLAMTSS